MKSPPFRLGLCCTFLEHPIKLRVLTAANLGRLPKGKQSSKIAEVALHNIIQLKRSLEYCRTNGIRAFRVSSQLIPLATHPELGFSLSDLPMSSEMLSTLEECRGLAVAADIRLTFHPDQFVVLNSPKADVVAQSIEELRFHAELAQLIGADTILIHGGGAYGDKKSALELLTDRVMKLPREILERFALENDDRVFTPEDLLPVCEATGVPLVYDVHHHRCLKDSLSEDEAMRRAGKTWTREQLVHISSPKGGWNVANPRLHDDYIDVSDFPDEWRTMPITVEVEAKAKELAIAKLASDLAASALY